MIYIAVCDKNNDYVEKIKNEIQKYFDSKKIKVEINTYICGHEFLKINKKYDIIILSQRFSDLQGLTVAKLLRKGINKNACLIFYTDHPEIAIEAYEVDTFRFVLKSSNKLYRALDDYLSRYYNKNFICVKSNKKEFLQIRINRIVFIETIDKISYIHLCDKSIIETRISLIELSEKISQKYFFKPHRSYIINFYYINSITKQEIIINDFDVKIPLSRNNIKLFRQRYEEFLSQKKGDIGHP